MFRIELTYLVPDNPFCFIRSAKCRSDGAKIVFSLSMLQTCRSDGAMLIFIVQCYQPIAYFVCLSHLLGSTCFNATMCSSSPTVFARSVQRLRGNDILLWIPYIFPTTIFSFLLDYWLFNLSKICYQTVSLPLAPCPLLLAICSLPSANFKLLALQNVFPHRHHTINLSVCTTPFKEE